MNKKGQMSGSAMAIIFAFAALMVIGVIQISSVLITSKVSGSITFDKDQLFKNDTVAITISTATSSSNSTLLTFDDVVAGSEHVQNLSGHVLVDVTEYTLVDATGNFTLVNSSYNTTSLAVTYLHNEDSAFETTADNLRTTNLDSFELGGTAQIVFAASVILLSVFGILAFMRLR